MAETKKRCAKRVFSGARNDMSGHRCERYALPGSDYCRTHDKDEQAKLKQQADATEPGELKSGKLVTYSASIQWDAGTGPLVPLPYRGGSGFITKVVARAFNDQPVEVTGCWGVVQKADGTPGIQTWDNSYATERLLPAEVHNRLTEAIRKERGL